MSFAESRRNQAPYETFCDKNAVGPYRKSRQRPPHHTGAIYLRGSQNISSQATAAHVNDMLGACWPFQASIQRHEIADMVSLNPSAAGRGVMRK